MNQQAYIRRVRRALDLPRRRRNDVLRDLDEIFASAHAHGENDAQIIARLGAPESFARDAQAALGGRHAHAALEWTLAAVFTLIAALLITLFVLSRPMDASIIGGADALTSIRVTAPFSPRPFEALAGAAALIAALLIALRRLHKSHLSKEE